MNRLILTILLIGGLIACVPQQREGPPAPIITAGQPAPKPAPAKPKPTAPPPRKKQVQVYPYRPPASAPDAATPRNAPPVAEKPRTDPGPLSERATNAPTKSAPDKRATPARSAPAPAAPTPRQIMASAASPPPAPPLSAAASTLIKQAERERRAKKYVTAAATLERALGIQPQEPYIWNRLARVRVEQGLYSQAGNLASRSNALAGNQQVALKQDNWIIIAAARQAAGDTAGAKKAQRHAQGG